MSLAEDLRDIVLRAIPWLGYMGRFRCRVTKHTSGRLDIEPVNATWIDPVALRDVWCGLPGCRVQPAVGDEVILEFIDRDPSQAVITGFAPLAQFRPVRIEIDASANVDLGGGTKTVQREGDTADGGTFLGTAGPLVYTGPDGKTWQVTGAVAGAIVNFTTTPLTAVSAKIVTKADPSTSRVRA